MSSLVRVQYLQVNGPQTIDNARAHVASLAGSQCGLVIAVGPVQVDAVVTAAPTFPTVPFVTVGGGESSANVSVVDDKSPDDLHAAIKQRVTALAESAS